MRTKRLLFMLPVSALLLLLGCGGSGSSSSTSTPASAAAMNVRLVDAPTSDFKEIDLDIQQVQIHQSSNPGESGWITLGSPGRVVNLLALQGGVVETLVAGATLAPGTYQQLRLVLGSRNSVVLNDGSTSALTVPSGMQTGVKMPGSFTVAAGTTADVFIDFDGAHSIHVHQMGPDRTYMLRPVVQCYDKAVTGSISGTLTATGGAPLAGVDVFAERIDLGGSATIVRSVKTSATGGYTLDLLPVGSSYFVVSMPVAGAVAYGAQASGELALSAAQPTLTFSAAFTPAAATGTLTGSISPVATTLQNDTVILFQSFPSAGGGTRSLVVLNTNVAVGASSETYQLGPVPLGTYNVQILRSTLNADGSSSLARSTLGQAVLAVPGATVAVNLAF